VAHPACGGTVLFHRPAPVEHIKLLKSDAKSRSRAGLSNAIWHFEPLLNIFEAGMYIREKLLGQAEKSGRFPPNVIHRVDAFSLIFPRHLAAARKSSLHL
jgi:hypothetical protein